MSEASTLRFCVKDSGRPHVRAAVSKIVERYHLGKSYTSIDVPPRCGKSDIIRLAAHELSYLDASFCIAVVAWAMLPIQLISDKSINDTRRYYCSSDTPRIRVDRIKHIEDYSFYKREAGKVDLFTATLQLLLANRITLLDTVGLVRERDGVKPVIFIDECQVLSPVQTWGGFVEELTESGAYVVVLTGTSIRKDGKSIPGFTPEHTTDWKERELRIRRRQHDEETGMLRYFEDTYSQKYRSRIDKADFTLTWEEAWNSKFLNKLNVVWVDCDVNGSQLSDVPASQVSKMLRTVSEEETTVAKVAAALIFRLCTWRQQRGLLDTRALIVTGSDLKADGKEHTGFNRHARQLRRAIEIISDQSGLQLNVQIATSVDSRTGEPDTAAQTKIEAFRGDADAIAKVGRIDILIVKAMCVVGLDVPELKVMASLSTMREGPMVIQGNSRTLTVWDEAKGIPSDLILLKDALNVRSIEAAKRSGGVDTETEHTDTREIPPPTPEFNEYEVKNVRITSYTNHRGEHAEGDHETVLASIKDKYQTFELTDVEILAIAASGGFPLETSSVEEKAREIEEEETAVDNLAKRTERLRGKFGEAARHYANARISYAQNPEGWRRYLAWLQAITKDRLGVQIPVDSIDDPDLLNRLIKELAEVARAGGQPQ